MRKNRAVQPARRAAPRGFALASAPAACHWAGMTDRNPRNPQAGGFLIVVAMFAGIGLGALDSQPVAGFLIGTAVGVLLAVGLWLWDRARG